MVEQDELLEMLPCSHCKNEKPHLVSCRPEGRTADLWRVECPCEKAPTQWSVSKTAAVRLWNRYMTNMKELLAASGFRRPRKGAPTFAGRLSASPFRLHKNPS